ncbi:hypothetical protein [Bifidobacterium platyrrhinorum]|uniref:Uncharacterized protein n=1 Tax=Bifidobacterium platyrrhinorum TaxID=2661628 RepID=A0A6L9SV55_9BIFI|nr:hypothetical protein [Bifidobacterium platyrrhinorum]NEG55422.1 hypothetical protein [Bifidobacterium platyrrhinorum]
MSYYLRIDKREPHSCPTDRCPTDTCQAVMHCACGKWYVANGYLHCELGLWSHRPAWWVRLFYRDAFDKLEHDDTDKIYIEEES